MLFSSEVFLFAFLPLTLALYFISPGARAKNVMLVAASLLFYAWGEGRYVVLLAALALFNYAFGLGITATGGLRRRTLVTAAIVVDLGVLIWFKYAGFFSQSVLGLFGLHLNPASPIAQVYLPLGVSFFTFHAISYVVDVYRRTTPPRRDPLELLLYFVLFPQLIAGPIIRYGDIAAQLARRNITSSDLAFGARRFVVGLGKKVLIADSLGVTVDRVFNVPPNEISTPLAWFTLAAYGLQIYFDFSGYSDMAIGLGRIFGFSFLENFNFPYVATSIRDFWRRWNISLSRWFRDYLYVPLGGNRVAPWRVYVNLLIVFVLCGLWHGAKRTFVAWGLIHGAFMILERIGALRRLTAIPLLRNVYVLCVVTFAWLFFRADSFGTALGFLTSMVHPSSTVTLTFWGAVQPETIVALVLGCVLATPVIAAPVEALLRADRDVPWVVGARLLLPGLLAVLFCVCTVRVVAGTYQPFIYFRF